jgi:cytosine/adenosine deaminase-related metal-dependent hydrolase
MRNRIPNARIDVKIAHGTLITMDARRRVLRDASVGIAGDTIVFVGPSAELEAVPADLLVDARGQVVLPGLIDTHAHAGHGLTKTLGEGGVGIGTDWDGFMERLYFQGTTPEFWRAEALLSGLERLRFGVTTGMSMLGSYPRFDDPDCWAAHAEGMARVGVRDILGIGTPNPPFPKTFRAWRPDGSHREYCLGHADSFARTREAVACFHGKNDGLSLCYPTPSGVGRRAPLSLEEHVAQNRAMREVAAEFGVPVHAHAYGGDVAFAREHFPFMLGPWLSLAHCTGISEQEVRLLADAGVSVCSGPATGAYIRARCPVVELIEAGCNVALCTDASAPDRTYDLFEKMRLGARLHRAHFHDNAVLPAGKLLEMVTVDAARALGLQDSLGSLEAGKRADLITVDMRRPHLYPPWQEPLRMVYQASGQDVDTVLVNGRLLMRSGRVEHLDEGDILEQAEAEAWKALRRLGLEEAASLPPRLWSASRY